MIQISQPLSNESHVKTNEMNLSDKPERIHKKI